MPSASGSYGILADKLWIDFKIFEILYRLKYLDFYFVNIATIYIYIYI